MDAPDKPPDDQKKRKRRSARCAECYRRKAKCSDRFPCDRCFAECHPCEPPADLLAPGQPLLELAIRTNDPRAVNEAYLQAFHRLQEAGRTRVDRAKIVLRGWRSMVIGRGVDVTHGLLDALTRALGLSAADVEPHAHAQDAHELAHVVGGEWRPEGAQAREELAKGVLAGEQMRMLGDRVTMMFGCHMTERGHFTSVSEAGARTLCSTSDLYGFSDQHQILNLHILYSMVAPEDRVAALEASLESFFTSEPRCSLIKFCNRDGDIDLYIFKVRIMPHASGPGLPEGVTMLGQLERAPASKHVSRRPGHRHRIVGSLRHDWGKASFSTPPPPPQASSSSSSSSSSPTPLPGLACLPVRAIPVADLQSLLSSPQAFPPCAPSNTTTTTAPAPLPSPPFLRGKQRRHISASSDSDSAAGDSSAVLSSEGGAAWPASPASTSTSTSAVPPPLLYLPTLGSGLTSGASTASSPGRPSAITASTPTSTSRSSTLSLGGLEGAGSAPLPAHFAHTAAVFTPPVVCGGFDMATILTATTTTTTTISVSVAQPQAQLQAAGAGKGAVELGVVVKPEVGEEGIIIDDDILQALLDPSLLPDPQ